MVVFSGERRETVVRVVMTLPVAVVSAAMRNHADLRIHSVVKYAARSSQSGLFYSFVLVYWYGATY